MEKIWNLLNKIIHENCTIPYTEGIIVFIFAHARRENPPTLSQRSLETMICSSVSQTGRRRGIKWNEDRRRKEGGEIVDDEEVGWKAEEMEPRS